MHFLKVDYGPSPSFTFFTFLFITWTSHNFFKLVQLSYCQNTAPNLRQTWILRPGGMGCDTKKCMGPWVFLPLDYNAVAMFMQNIAVNLEIIDWVIKKATWGY